MAAREINLDKVVDYRAEYAAVVQKYKLARDKLTGLCPFHEDRNNSFSVDLKTGKWHCFAEGRGGNFVSFWAELHGVDTKEAYKQILEKYGVTAETPKPAKKEKTTVLEDFSLAEYAFAKHLPEEWLAKTCRLETRKDRNNGTAWLYISHNSNYGLFYVNYNTASNYNGNIGCRFLFDISNLTYSWHGQPHTPR